MTADTLTSLCSELCQAAKIVEQLQDQEVSFNSCKTNDESKWQTSSAVAEELTAARKTILNNSLKLRQLVSGPIELHQQTVISYQMLFCVQWLIRFRIPEHVPLTDKVSYQTLSEKASVPLVHLQRAVRFAIANGLFKEEGLYYVVHNSLSASFCTNADFTSTMKWMIELNLPIAQRFADMTSEWNGSASTVYTAHNLAMDTDLPFYAYLSQSPGRMIEMAGAMRFVGKSEGQHIKHLVKGYDWAKLGAAVVVDMGGSQGHASIALAEAYPELHFIVQDLPGPIEKAKLNGDKVPKSVASRIKFEAHNFFVPQTSLHEGKPTVYLMRQIFANWPDEQARHILTSLIPSLEANRETNRMLIMSKVLDPPSAQSRARVGHIEEALDRAQDLFMLQAMNGIERSTKEWEELLKSADERLAMKTVTCPAGSQLSIIELENLARVLFKVRGEARASRKERKDNFFSSR